MSSPSLRLAAKQRERPLENGIKSSLYAFTRGSRFWPPPSPAARDTIHMRHRCRPHRISDLIALTSDRDSERHVDLATRRSIADPSGDSVAAGAV